MQQNNFPFIEKTASNSKKLLRSMASGAMLGGGLMASSAYEKSKERGTTPSMTMINTLDDTAIGLGAGAIAGAASHSVKSGVSNGVRKAGNAIRKIASEEKIANAISTVAVPAILMGALSGDKAKEVAEDNPYLPTEEDKNRFVKGKQFRSGAIGAGIGVGINMLKKKAEILVPEKEEISEEESYVRDSPNEKEKRELAEPINRKTLRHNRYKHLIEKTAKESVDSYLKPIDCESCGYKGLPRSIDGSCPKCGTLGGKVYYPETIKDDIDLDSKERNLTSVWEMGERERYERLSYYR